MRFTKSILFSYAITSFFLPVAFAGMGPVSTIKVNCTESLGKVQKLIRQLETSCLAAASVDLNQSCPAQADGAASTDQFSISVQSTDCSFLGASAPAADREKCQQVIKLSASGSIPDLCVNTIGLLYLVENDEQVTSRVAEMTSSMQAASCKLQSKAQSVRIATGKLGYYFPSNNCYLLSNKANVQNCKPGYEKVLLGAKNNGQDQYVCRLTSESSGKANKSNSSSTGRVQ